LNPMKSSRSSQTFRWLFRARRLLKSKGYDAIPQFKGNMCQKWRYQFQRNGAYIVFAKKTEDIHIHRQLWIDVVGKEDQGIFLCSDDKPVTANNVKGALWNELAVMLHSKDFALVTYAIQFLDRMSGGRDMFDGSQDFDRSNVVKVIHDLRRAFFHAGGF
jgi:hypothetical protein